MIISNSFDSPIKILVTQPYSGDLALAYSKIVKKHGARVKFQSFIHVNPIPTPVFRKYKGDINDYDVLIFTTKTAMDCFFQLSEACGIKVSVHKKYLCATKSLKNYLRKYVEFKKRKVFCGTKRIEDLFPLITRYKKDSFLVPSSNERKEVLRDFFKEKKYKYKEIIIYDTKLPNLEGLNPADYDVIVFFSPITVNSFSQNFPNYEQGATQIASFNEMTALAVKKLGWKTTISPQQLKASSIVDALDIYLREKGKN